MNIEVLWDGAYGLSPLSEKTRKSNHLQMSLQRQHFLPSYLRWPNTVCARFTDSVSDAIKRALGLW